ncbi:hypothetical protein N9O37_03865 [Candidatus Pelagibacter sp.]|jgi:hypothetical protein|nr:hypothetical protein [Candidatus Pelagibacter sp.]
MIEKISSNNSLLAILLKNTHKESGVNFFTENSNFLQLGYMQYGVGKIIKPHRHLEVKRTINTTQECLFIRKGKLQVDFYLPNNELLCSRILEEKDTLLIISGAHGFKVLEDIEMIEIKQGPYNDDKVFIKTASKLDPIK